MKPRKKYVPKYVSRNPLSEVFGGMSGVNVDRLQGTLSLNHMALARIVTGSGDKDDFNRLAGACNVAVVLSEQGIGPEFRAEIIAGRDALIEMGKRAMRTGRFVFRGDELAAVNAAFDCHDTQMENIRAIDVDRAADEVIKRFRQGHKTSIKAEVEREAA